MRTRLFIALFALVSCTEGSGRDLRTDDAAAVTRCYLEEVDGCDVATDAPHSNWKVSADRPEPAAG